MPTPSLKEFAEPVPVCEQTAGLADLLEIFRWSGGEAIVVVSEQQLPLGVVHLRQVMPHLLSLAGLGGSPALMSTPQLHKPLFQLQPLVVEPLAILPAQVSLSQFWTYLQESDDYSRQWALVEEDGTFLGLLNSWRLLKILSLNVRLTDTPFGTPSESQPNNLKPLAQLLEQLPLPLSVQTATGQVLAQNLTWRQQIGKSPDVDWVRRTTATMLDVPSVESRVNQKSDSKLRERIGSQSVVPTAKPTNPLPRSQTGILDSSLRTDGSTALGQSQLPTNRVAHPEYEPMGHRSVDRYCAIDTPRMAVSVSQRHLLLSTPPPSSQNASVPASETRRQNHDHVFSFVKMPLSSSAILQEPREPGEPKSREEILAPSWTKQQFNFSEPKAFYDPRTDAFKANASRLGSAQPIADVATPPNSKPNDLINPTQAACQTRTSSQLPSASSSDLWLVLAQDTTEQEQVAKELAAKNADLVQLNRLKDEFLACISHELKTPLTAVLGLSSLLKDQALGSLNERQARYARLIYQSGRQLMTIVNDILDLTRMETGQLELTLEPVQIKTVCDRAHTQARQRPSEKDYQEEESASEISFTLEIEPGLKTIVADELRLRQMLVNLLSNALKFTDSSGEIGLRVNRWDGWVAFTVWDTGIGIPAEKQHLIFQKFQQLENPLTRRFEGTGLGLVLTQRLARLHGGDISFISKAGEGSEFTLLLPPCPPQSRGKAGQWQTAIEEDQGMNELGDTGSSSIDLSAFPHLPSSESSSCPIEEQPEPHNRLVLIVETVLRYLEGLTEQLESLGYRVVIARSGTDAIAKARSLQPCAILLNPLLPQLSGWDVLTLLKSDAQTHHIPVLVTATQAEKQQAYQNKADGFLSLPVQKQALQESLAGLGEPQHPSTSSLTILHLSPDLAELRSDSSVLSAELTEALSLQHSNLNYRLLEADDLEQAELLARVWHLDVILLDGSQLADPLAFLQEFSLRTSLASLPVVTLDQQTTEAANQVTCLSVYPCLATDNQTKVAALLQVIQLAAGMISKPSILAVDIPMLGKELQIAGSSESKVNQLTVDHDAVGSTTASATSVSSCQSCNLNTCTPWLQALIQYLETAGFRSLLSCSWAELYRQLQDHSLDLLLIRLTDISDYSALMNALIYLAQLPQRPPILILDHRSDGDREVRSELSHRDTAATDNKTPMSELDSLLKAVATKILRGSTQSMAQLLDEIASYSS